MRTVSDVICELRKFPQSAKVLLVDQEIMVYSEVRPGLKVYKYFKLTDNWPDKDCLILCREDSDE